jgi:imidazoleglycerol-phosphate dehydratase
MDRITVSRTTTESSMEVVYDFSPIKPDYRKKINTTIPFLNHMIEHIAWRGGFNIETKIEMDEFLLTHVICEDLGMAMGKAAADYIRRHKEDGVMGYGDAIGIIDEAKAQCAMSFESRALCLIDYHGIQPESKTEGMDREDLETFLEGFCQGAQCTLQIDLMRGQNGHHIWEAIYRSVGSALHCVFALDESRKGMTSGVAGTIEWSIK